MAAAGVLYSLWCTAFRANLGPKYKCGGHLLHLPAAETGGGDLRLQGKGEVEKEKGSGLAANVTCKGSVSFGLQGPWEPLKAAVSG